jgi:HTH-type transcriptional regulator/antitoxin HigA
MIQEAATRKFDRRVYAGLLTKVLPRIITSETEYVRLEAKFKELIRKKRSIEEDSIFDLLANLLEDYERRTLKPLESASPVEILRFLMQENGLKQSDMVEYFGSQGNISQVISGKRRISRNAAIKLAERFKLSPAAFMD